MEKQKLMEAAKDSISEVLETMFFLPIDTIEAVDSVDFTDEIDDDMEIVEMEFSGMYSGSFLLMIPDDLALFLTASFLGNIEDQVLPMHIRETKKEMTNMIAGNTFAHFNDEIEFDLQIPHILNAEEAFRRSRGSREIIYQSHTLEKFLFVKMTLNE